jgi:hypothetical protein
MGLMMEAFFYWKKIRAVKLEEATALKEKWAKAQAPGNISIDTVCCCKDQGDF